jgi:hypothetical protein
MRQLEDVLDSIDNLNGSVLVNLAYISCMDEAFRINNCCSLLFILEVALEGVLPSEADLTLREGFTISIYIVGLVVHLWNIYQLDLTDLDWSTAVTREVIGGERNSNCSRRFCLAVALNNWAAESNFEHVLDFWMKWRCTCHYQSHLATKNSLEAIEDCLVIHEVGASSIGFDSCKFSLQSSLGHALLGPFKLVNSLLD